MISPGDLIQLNGMYANSLWSLPENPSERTSEITSKNVMFVVAVHSKKYNDGCYALCVVTDVGTYGWVSSWYMHRITNETTIEQAQAG